MHRAISLLLIMGSFSYPLSVGAQQIESKLSGNTDGHGFTVLDNANNPLFTVRGTGRTGIGTGAPAFRLSLDSDGGILAKGTMNSGVTLPAVSGSLLIWYPRKAAFRAGFASGSIWNDSNIGLGSFAAGIQSQASGSSSAAIGSGTTATGDYAVALGESTSATGMSALALGSGSTASGTKSVAIGTNVTASGLLSTAIGCQVSTNGKEGVMYLGDASSTTTRNAYANNHFYAVFDHGFSLFTDASAGNNYCVYLLNHSTSWLSCSDSTKKERYKASTGEEVLGKFRKLRLGSWNFIGHDPLRERHYGPMAQEWFSAFGHDGIGGIGNDTLLASADVDGIAYIAIQALERRTAELQEEAKEVSELRRQLSVLHEQNASEVSELRGQISELREEMRIMRREFASIRAQQQSSSHVTSTFPRRP